TGKYRHGEAAPAGSRAEREPDHFDYADDGDRIRERKLDATERLLTLAADAGLSLIHLALAFGLGHPAVAAAILWPRTMDPLLDHLDPDLPALDDALLDAIDAVVPPGINLNQRDAGWTPPALTDAMTRRRSR